MPSYLCASLPLHVQQAWPSCNATLTCFLLENFLKIGCHYMLPSHHRNSHPLNLFSRCNITVCLWLRWGMKWLKGFVKDFQGNGDRCFHWLVFFAIMLLQKNGLVERWFIDQLSDVRSDLFIICLYHRVSSTREEKSYLYFFLKTVL